MGQPCVENHLGSHPFNSGSSGVQLLMVLPLRCIVLTPGSAAKSHLTSSCMVQLTSTHTGRSYVPNQTGALIITLIRKYSGLLLSILRAFKLFGSRILCFIDLCIRINQPEFSNRTGRTKLFETLRTSFGLCNASLLALKQLCVSHPDRAHVGDKGPQTWLGKVLEKFPHVQVTRWGLFLIYSVSVRIPPATPSPPV